MTSIFDLETPAALVDVAKMHANILQMQNNIAGLGCKLRPHIKTAKCNPITRAQLEAGACGITVSTLKEAEESFRKVAVTDILYAVCISPNKLQRAFSLIQEGCDLKLLTDSVGGAAAISAFGSNNKVFFKVLIEIDTDDHRSGVKPESALLLEVAEALTRSNTATGGAIVFGVMTHAGESYHLHEEDKLIAFAEQERSRCVRAAERLRSAGYSSCECVSIGSTPTALSYNNLQDVDEVRAGVYIFFDLVMANIGVCKLENIALSVLTAVIGHQTDKSWVIVDAGWMAMSRDRGIEGQIKDYGYGQVCNVQGEPIQDVIISGANQEHGIIQLPEGVDIVKDYPVGRLLRVLPNHSCATAAQFPLYHLLGSTDGVGSSGVASNDSSDILVTGTWEKYTGW